MSSLRLRSRGIRRLSLLPATALLALGLAACGGGDDDGDAADPSGTSPSSDAASTDAATTDATEESAAFQPVTIDHAFGSTTIEEKPETVVALGWGAGDAAIALGTIPVALDAQSYGATENGLMPWVEEAVTEAGGELPDTLTTGDSPAFEEILAEQPDVILANYSGISEADYDKLAQIAPTVAYPDQPWSTPWRDVITTVGQVLGETDAADELLAGIDEQVSAAAEAHPEFEGKTIAAVAIDPGAFYVYTPADPRVQFLEDLGFVSAPSVEELADDQGGFFYTLSLENLDQLTSDVLLSYENDEAQNQAIAGDASYQVMEQFQAGTVASVIGEANVSSVSPPTALSLDYSLDTFVEALAGAVPSN